MILQLVDPPKETDWSCLGGEQGGEWRPASGGCLFLPFICLPCVEPHPGGDDISNSSWGNGLLAFMEINTSTSEEQAHQVQATAVPLSAVSGFLLSLQLVLPLKTTPAPFRCQKQAPALLRTALRPHVAGLGDLRVESPICLPDCCLANASTCRVQAHMPPVPWQWGPERALAPQVMTIEMPSKSTPGLNGTECVWAGAHSPSSAAC